MIIMGEVIFLGHSQKQGKQLDGRTERVRRLDGALKQKAPFSAADQERAARNTHEMLEELRQTRQLKKLNIVRAAGLGGEGTDSTKQLYTYTLPPDADDRRRDRVAKKPDRYFSIASAVADLLHTDRAEFLCRIFEGCSFGTGMEFHDDWEEESWAVFARQLGLMGKSLIAELNLTQFWREVQRTDGRYDVLSECYVRAREPLWMESPHYGLAGNRTHFEEIAPVPSVRLLMKKFGDSPEGLLDVEGHPPFSLAYEHWLDVRLALAPSVKADDISALLEFRSILMGRAEDGFIVKFDRPFTDGSDRITTAWIKGKPRKVKDISLDFWGVPVNPYNTDAEHSYFSWREISPGLLREIFGDETSLVIPSERLLGIDWVDRPQTRFVTQRLAAITHRELLSGELEKELAAVARKLIEQFHQHRDELRARSLAADQIAEDRWTAILKKHAND